MDTSVAATPSLDLSTAREHAWKYFEVHANQRMALFNFFIVLSGLLLTGIGVCITGADNLRIPGVILCVGLTFISLIFYKLDQRTRFFIKRAELVLAELEIELPVCARLFREEPGATQQAAKDEAVWTYGRSFRFVFWISGLIGFVCLYFVCQ
jgi:hypothetical protein